LLTFWLVHSERTTQPLAKHACERLWTWRTLWCEGATNISTCSTDKRWLKFFDSATSTPNFEFESQNTITSTTKQTQAQAQAQAQQQSVIKMGLLSTLILTWAIAPFAAAVKRARTSNPFLRNVQRETRQTQCDCSSYNSDVCYGGYTGEGSSSLPSDYDSCYGVCCECSCKAITEDLCVACLDADACDEFLYSCAKDCCIVVSEVPTASPTVKSTHWGNNGWGGGTSDEGGSGGGNWGASSGGGSKPKPPAKKGKLPKINIKPKVPKKKSHKKPHAKKGSKGGAGGSWGGENNHSYDYTKTDTNKWEGKYNSTSTSGRKGLAAIFSLKQTHLTKSFYNLIHS